MVFDIIIVTLFPANPSSWDKYNESKRYRQKSLSENNFLQEEKTVD